MTIPDVQWGEKYERDSPEFERRVFEKLAQDIMGVQLTIQRRIKSPNVQRAFHAKALFSATNAQLTFRDDLPPDLCTSFAKSGASYLATVRLSNAAGGSQPDSKPDMRGMALRIEVAPGQAHDLLATNYPVSHARNARQFVAFAKATAGGPLGRAVGVLNLCLTFGAKETVRMLSNVLRARHQKVSSLALETYWSRGATRWGPTLAVRYQLRPSPDTKPLENPPHPSDPNFLADEFKQRLASGSVHFELCIQLFVDEASTPIEDTAVEWTEQDSPPIPVAVLTINLPGASATEVALVGRVIESSAFNPWNTSDEHRPLGNLNRARKAVYDAGAAQRLGYRWLTQTPLRNQLFSAAARRIFRVINGFIPWYKLPLRASLLNLDGFRYVLRRQNLIDTEVREAPPRARSVPAPIPERSRRTRAFNGTDDDLSARQMGALGANFGRNLRPVYAPDLFDTPNPRMVADRLLQRDAFIPATSLNILAAAWIQFQVHDWVDHARNPLGVNDVVVPLRPGSGWRSSVNATPVDEMRIAGNTGLDERRPSRPPIYFRNATTHWWDTSELYGQDVRQVKTLFDGPKFILPDGHLPTTVNGMEITGFHESWWLGLSAMHLLFAREHNLLCDELHAAYPTWESDRLFQTARLIVAALIAKIHTVEWTPAILATKTIDVGLHANWNGPPPHDWATRIGLWLLDAHSLTGIPKTTPDHHAAPYSLTEDFVTVYRMHPLVPDDYCFYDHSTGAKLHDRSFAQIQGAQTDQVMRETGLRNTLYSFGIAYPGAITLHNFPNALRRFERTGAAPASEDKEIIDMAVVDLVRARRRGVPRYNDFREGLHKPRIKRWEDLASNPDDVAILQDVYGHIDRVDTMVGLFAEPLPAGFGFSDTAFRIFILMASRRLQSDRFLTVDFRPEIYSPLGMDWIANNGMRTVIQHHCPELAPLMPRDATAFAPWRPIIPDAKAVP
jgi:zinc transporter ZupT